MSPKYRIIHGRSKRKPAFWGLRDACWLFGAKCCPRQRGTNPPFLPVNTQKGKEEHSPFSALNLGPSQSKFLRAMPLWEGEMTAKFAAKATCKGTSIVSAHIHPLTLTTLCTALGVRQGQRQAHSTQKWMLLSYLNPGEKSTVDGQPSPSTIGWDNT